MDPLDQSWRWDHWVATGTEETVSAILTNLDSKLPCGWRRLSEDDLIPLGPLFRPGSAWYGLDPDGARSGMALGIEKPTPYRIRGGWVRSPFRSRAASTGHAPASSGQEAQCQDERSTRPDDPKAWIEVDRFLDEGIVPAARAAGAEIEVPPPEERIFFEIPFEVGRRLRDFAGATPRSLPLEPRVAGLWREFAVAVFRQKARFETEWFVRWLVSVGWLRETAAQLYEQLVEDCLLLSTYADEVSAA